MTSTLRASARRKPPSAVTGPCANTVAPRSSASRASPANASRFNRTHARGESVARHRRPARTGRMSRAINSMGIQRTRACLVAASASEWTADPEPTRWRSQPHSKQGSFPSGAPSEARDGDPALHPTILSGTATGYGDPARQRRRTGRSAERRANIAPIAQVRPSSWLASDDARRPVHHVEQRLRQPDAEHKQSAQQQTHSRDTDHPAADEVEY